MAMTSASLKGRLESKLKAAFGSDPSKITADVSPVALAIAEAVLEELQQNGQVAIVQPLAVTHPMGPGQVVPVTLPAGTTIK